MRIKNLNKSAFTLIEILMAAIIFVITVAGVFATLNSVRAPVTSSESNLTTAVFGKQVLEALRSQIGTQPSMDYYACGTANANGTCGDFALSLGQHQVSTATLSGFGLTWPTSLTAFNGASTVSPAASFSPVLDFTVTCADSNINDCVGTTGHDLAHEVQLKICIDSTC